MDFQDIANLEEKIDALISLVVQLKNEKEALEKCVKIQVNKVGEFLEKEISWGVREEDNGLPS